MGNDGCYQLFSCQIWEKARLNPKGHQITIGGGYEQCCSPVKDLFCGVEGDKRQILVAILNTCGAKESRVKTKDCIMTSTYWRPRDEGKGNVRGGTWETWSIRYQGNEAIESKLSHSKEKQQIMQEMNDYSCTKNALVVWESKKNETAKCKKKNTNNSTANIKSNKANYNNRKVSEHGGIKWKANFTPKGKGDLQKPTGWNVGLSWFKLCWKYFCKVVAHIIREMIGTQITKEKNNVFLNLALSSQ